MSEYPKRERFFAHKFVRLLLKSCAAMDIGHQACLLVVHIAHTEDAARYKGDVRYWNEQLQNTLALTPKQLRAARDKAVKFGWLHYDREHDRAVGRYWVVIPERAIGLDDNSIEDVPVDVSCPNQHIEKDKKGSVSCPPENIERDNEGTSKGTTKGHRKGQPSNPIPIPDPIPKDKGEETVAVAPCPSSEIIQAFDATFGTNSILTAKRKIALSARWKDPWWRENWAEALSRGKDSAFLRGANDRGWVIGVDFFLKPDSAAKILEGTYDNRTNGAQSHQRLTPTQQREVNNASGLERIARAHAAAVSCQGGRIGSNGSASLLSETGAGVDTTPV